MATYAWTFDNVAITSTTVLAPQTVSLGQVFAALTMPADDDYRLAIRISGISLDVAAGPFTVTVDAARGNQSVQLGGGDGALLSAGDVVVLKDGVGNEMVNEVDPTHIGADLVPLKERLVIDLPGTTSSIERTPSITVSGSEGVGSAAGPAAKTETIFLTESAEFKGWWMTRIRWDRGSSITISTFDFTATEIRAHEYVDHVNVFRSDRRTPRDLLAANAVAPVALTSYPNPFLSWGSGHKVSAKGFPATIDRYAEQHPPVRLEVEVTAGLDFTGGVTITGFRSIWSPVRGTFAAASGSIRVSPEAYSQFQVGDVVTLKDLTGNLKEAQTIASKTAPDLLNLVGVTANAYGLDDVIGIEQTETIAVAAGIGTYYSADAWVYPYEYATAGGTEDFTFMVRQSVQGYCGELHSVDNRLGAGIATTALRQCNGSYQIAVGQVAYGDGVTPCVYGGVGDFVVYPRHVDAQLLSAATLSILWFGSKTHFGVPVNGLNLMRGALAGSSDLWQILGDAENGVVGLQLGVRGRKVVAGTDAGRCDVLDPAWWRMRETVIEARNIYRQSSTDVRARNVRSSIDSANRAVLGGAGADYQVNAPTNLADFQIVQSHSAYARGVSFIPTATFPLTSPIRIRGVNATAQHGTDRDSGEVSLLGGANGYAGRCISCYFSEIEIQGNAFVTKRLESAFVFNIRVIAEYQGLAIPIPNARVVVHDVTGTIVVNELTDVFGCIVPQEIVSHRWEIITTAGTVIWRVEDTPPAAVTFTTFRPFDLAVYPQPSGGAPGLVPSHAVIDALPLMPEDRDLTIVLHAPRPDGQFGDAAFGEF